MVRHVLSDAIPSVGVSTLQRPEPRSAANSTGIAMKVAQDRRLHSAAKTIVAKPNRQPAVIKQLQVREYSAHHNRIRVQNIYNRREPSRHPVDEPVERILGLLVATLRSGHDLRAAKIAAGHPRKIPRKTGAGDPHLKAAVPPAIAEWSRNLRRICPRQRRVPPLSSQPVGARMDSAVNRDATTATGAKDHTEDHLKVLRRTIGRLADRKAIGIVRATHLAAQRFAQVPLERLSIHPRRVRILHQPSRADNRTRNSHTHRTRLLRGRLQLTHQAGNAGDGSRVVALWRRHADPLQFNSLCIKSDRLNLRPTNIHANTHYAPDPAGFFPIL